VEVSIPVEVNAPPFLTQDWLKKTVEKAVVQYLAQDTNARRVRPMALVRCSRGGKTRALYEIAGAWKERFPNCAVIFVSFNDTSSIHDWEQSKPLEALLRRIAFSARNNRDLTFSNFRYVNVTETDIVKWLGSTPCVLLIDELNKIESLRSESGESKRFASFLKSYFLDSENNYCIFSSHIVSTAENLVDYMSGLSTRGVIVQHLPLIPSIEIAKRNFKFKAYC
jgi:hypothetical protein